MRALTLLCVMLSSCATVPEPSVDAYLALTGAAAFERIRQTSQAAKDEVATTYIDCLSTHLFLHADTTPTNPPFEVMLIEDAEPELLALPGGKFVITTGFLSYADDESVLAAALAEEIVSVTSGLLNKQWYYVARRNAVDRMMAVDTLREFAPLTVDEALTLDAATRQLLLRAGIDPFGSVRLLWKDANAMAAERDAQDAGREIPGRERYDYVTQRRLEVAGREIGPLAEIFRSQNASKQPRCVRPGRV